ncbi:MAG: DEAD/DEAH box helicase, partial [Muribaculaceae bacterium]|nr:DEAD/DEAH box helicase [Muribaculaceae bacterium]
MEKKEIISNARKSLGVEQLTGMQSAMADCDSNEIIVLAPTGSGKTLAMALRILRAIGKPNSKRTDGHADVKAVIMAPSRELVTQIAGVIRVLAPMQRTVALYGGHSMMDEKRSLLAVPDIVVATPGRLLDHLNRKQVDLGYACILVLDEYDKALELGFADEMRRITARMPRRRITVLTSATPLADMPEYLGLKNVKVLDYTAAGEVSEAEPDLTVCKVESTERDKLGSLLKLLRSLDNGKAIVFVNHRESAERVGNTLVKAGLPAGVYHGGLEQQERQTSIDMLNNGSKPVLVSTDLGSRGLDIDNINYVIHYHMPPTHESWTHRNGRTARMGASGCVYVIQGPDEDLPEYVVCDDEIDPSGESGNPIKASMGTIYFKAGKREKLSKGDIAGFLINKGGLMADEVGKINVYDHYALAAVKLEKLRTVLGAIRSEKIKNMRVR